jgi:hypothetical protein
MVGTLIRAGLPRETTPTQVHQVQDKHNDDQGSKPVSDGHSPLECLEFGQD